MTEPDAPRTGAERSDRTTLGLFVAAGLVLVLLFAYFAAYLWVGGAIPRGTTVAGVDLGGMTEAEAVDALNTELADRSDRIQLDLQGKLHEMRAQKLGLGFDPAATVASVPGREVAPQALLGQVGGQEIAPVVNIDQQKLDHTVKKLAHKIDDPVRQARIEYDNETVVVVTPRTGSELDRDAAASAIVDHYLVTSSPVILDAQQVVPFVSDDEAQAFADSEAAAAVSAPITLTLAGEDIEVTAEQIASVLSYRATDSGMTPKVDAQVLREMLADPLSQVGKPARDAIFDVSSGTPEVVPDKTGRGVDDESLKAGVVEALESSTRSASLELERVEPDLTTAEAKDLGVTERISTFTQEFPYAAYRVTNIGIASSKINGTILEPGETFSMNGVVGERTPENGFVVGYVIEGGRLVEDYGGAVSTITTAMWHTAFYAGMTRVEQRAHGFWISRYIAGLEATVSWGYLDLKFRNDTPYGVYITSSLTDSSVTTTMWSTKYWDIKAEFSPRENFTSPGTVYDTGSDCVPQTGVSGFDITVTRVWSRSGEVIKREPLPTHYDAAPTVICGPNPADQPADKPGDKPGDGKSDQPGSQGDGSGGDTGGGGSAGGSGGGGSSGGGGNGSGGNGRRA
ncbi:MAG: VanW family protein [Actinomycetes bacterium]